MTEQPEALEVKDGSDEEDDDRQPHHRNGPVQKRPDRQLAWAERLLQVASSKAVMACDTEATNAA